VAGADPGSDFLLQATASESTATNKIVVFTRIIVLLLIISSPCISAFAGASWDWQFLQVLEELALQAWMIGNGQ
jgi:hypothetical protein